MARHDPLTNPLFLGLEAFQASQGNTGGLASILAQRGPPPTIASAPAPFPVPSLGRGILPQVGKGLTPLPPQSRVAPQALANAAAPSPVSPTSPGGILPGGSPGGPGPGGVNPLEALVPPTVSPQQQIPQAGRPGLGGQINPQIMQLIMQMLQGGGPQQQPQQSLGQILGQVR